VTRIAGAGDRLPDLAPWPRPLVPELHQAPELSIFTALHATLPAVLVALIAEHPSVADLARPGEVPTVRLARRLVAAALALGDALDDYRRAVLTCAAPAAALLARVTAIERAR
jgi:hypothetical protein